MILRTVEVISKREARDIDRESQSCGSCLPFLAQVMGYQAVSFLEDTVLKKTKQGMCGRAKGFLECCFFVHTCGEWDLAGMCFFFNGVGGFFVLLYMPWVLVQLTKRLFYKESLASDQKHSVYSSVSSRLA